MKTHAEMIFRAGLERVNSRRVMQQVLKLAGEHLTIETESVMVPVNLADYSAVKIIGIGKAAAEMARGLCEVLGPRVVGGVIVVRDPVNEALPAAIEVHTGGHPIPNEASEKAGRRLREFCEACTDKELVLGVISGGASALAVVPAEGLKVADLQTTTELLMASGAYIAEMNCVRKHLSAIKGGQLARALSAAMNINFILSDVVRDDLSVIGSGPTVPDESTFTDALTVLQKYDLKSKLPKSVVDYIEAGVRGEKLETPKEGDPAFDHTRNILVGTNRQALLSARAKAIALGYDTQILTHEIEGEAREVAGVLYELGQEILENKERTKPMCLLAGGETTVTLRGNGKGGRNQELALAYISQMAAEVDTIKTPHIFLSATTDGSDGPTDAAGAFASPEILERAISKKLNPADFLERNDSYSFFEKVEELFKTGPTGTNVCDLQILLVPLP